MPPRHPTELPRSLSTDNIYESIPDNKVSKLENTLKHISYADAKTDLKSLRAAHEGYEENDDYDEAYTSVPDPHDVMVEPYALSSELRDEEVLSITKDINHPPSVQIAGDVASSLAEDSQVVDGSGYLLPKALFLNDATEQEKAAMNSSLNSKAHKANSVTESGSESLVIRNCEMSSITSSSSSSSVAYNGNEEEIKLEHAYLGINDLLLDGLSTDKIAGSSGGKTVTNVTPDAGRLIRHKYSNILESSEQQNTNLSNSANTFYSTLEKSESLSSSSSNKCMPKPDNESNYGKGGGDKLDEFGYLVLGDTEENIPENKEDDSCPKLRVVDDVGYLVPIGKLSREGRASALSPSSPHQVETHGEIEQMGNIDEFGYLELDETSL